MADFLLWEEIFSINKIQNEKQTKHIPFLKHILFSQQEIWPGSENQYQPILCGRNIATGLAYLAAKLSIYQYVRMYVYIHRVSTARKDQLAAPWDHGARCSQRLIISSCNIIMLKLLTFCGCVLSWHWEEDFTIPLVSLACSKD